MSRARRIYITAWQRWEGVLWFRVLGWGLHFKDLRVRRLAFFERQAAPGYQFWLRRTLRIGFVQVRLLTPGDILHPLSADASP